MLGRQIRRLKRLIAERARKKSFGGKASGADEKATAVRKIDAEFPRMLGIRRKHDCQNGDVAPGNGRR